MLKLAKGGMARIMAAPNVRRAMLPARHVRNAGVVKARSKYINLSEAKTLLRLRNAALHVQKAD